MDRPMSKFSFQMMSFFFIFRDRGFDPKTWLEEANVKEGMKVVDYGCGPGTYTLGAAKMVKETGTVYALDIHPLAHKKIARKAKKQELSNIISMIPKGKIDLPDNSIDVVLLYDVFHMFSQKDTILKEIYRILVPDGMLSFSDHHMREADIIEAFENRGQFQLERKNLYTFNFKKK